MSATLNYNDIVVRMPLGCDITKLVAFVKSMGGWAISVPTMREEKQEATVDDIFGVWSDTDYPSADKMCDFLKEERTSALTRDIKLDAAWL